MKMNILDDCYSLLEKETPLKFDCGILCNSQCCKGDDKTGMLLFPGEADLLKGEYEIIETDGRKYAVCDGSCNRRLRPLACRIYPLFPLVEKDENGIYKIEVIKDPRARCPITAFDAEFKRSFIRKVKLCGEFLLTDSETADFLTELSDEINEYEELAKKLK